MGALILAVVLAFVRCGTAEQVRSFPFRTLGPGSPLPPVRVCDLQGREVCLAEYAAQGVTAIAFWGADSPLKRRHSMEALRALGELRRRFGARVKVAAVASPETTSQVIEEVARELDRPPLLLLDPEGRAYGAFGVFVLPCVVVVKDGRVAAGLGWSLQLPERLAGEVAVCLGERSRREVEEELRPRPQKPAQRLEAERFLRLALVMEQRGMFASAEEAARKAVEADGEFGAAWVELARICLREGKLQDARRALRRALELCPESPDARLVSAQLKAEEGKPREALAELRELSLREPRNPYLYRLMGQIYERLGMCPEALRSYKRALDLLLRDRETP